MAEQPAPHWLARAGHIGRWLENSLLVAFLAALILLAGGQILLRNVFETGFIWADELLRVLVLWVALLGAVAASRDNKHINVDVLSRLVPARFKPTLSFILYAFTALVCGVAAAFAGQFVYGEFQYDTPGLAGLPAWALEIILPLAFGLIAWRYLVFALQILFVRQPRA